MILILIDMKIANDKRRAAQIVQPKDLNLQMMFAECNHLYFNDELKEIPIEFEPNNVNYGEFYYDITPKGIDNCHIKIADNHERTKKEYVSTLVHEMIHYYLAYKHIDNEITHGEAFLKMSEGFNRKYGLNITERVDCSRFKPCKIGKSWFYQKIYIYLYCY